MEREDRRGGTARATLVGGVAVLLWATLAPLMVAAGEVSPFLLLALAFGIAGLAGVGVVAAAGARVALCFKHPPAAWALGLGGLFGYHLLYVLALRAAPPVEANLINYLWPLLLVLGSALLPGERLRWTHAAGAVLGLAGAALLISRGGTVAFDPAHALGFAMALGSGATWAAYSLLSRRRRAVPTAATAGFCLGTAALALVAHLLLEPPGLPATAGAWLAVAALGLGPVGLAFYVWDYGVKYGDIQALGTLAYAAPLLSTLLLILFGPDEGGWHVWAAGVLIIAGAALAARGAASAKA